VTRKPFQGSTSHQHLYRAVADRDAVAQPQLGAYPPGAVDAVGGRVDLRDQVGQPRVPDRPGRGSPVTPGVEPRLRHRQDPACCLDRQALLGYRRDRGEPGFWAHRLLEQLAGTLVDRQLGLQLRDPTPGRCQLCLLRRGQSWLVAGVDAVLPAPGVDRLVADLEVMRDLRDRAASLEQVEDLATELRRVTPGHADLSSEPSA
jgi:hypothetical protein